MENNNFISYLSTGQDSFVCEFEVEKEEQIEVIVEDKQLEYLNDYTIQDFNEKIKIIKLKEKLGSSLYPKIIILKRNVDIQRKTNFNDDSQIKANLLNIEFDNLISNQAYLKDFLIQLSKGLIIKEDNEDGGSGNGEVSLDIDPRNWSEEINIVNLEDGFDVDNVKEVSLNDPKPFSHNIYFVYAKDASTLPDSLIYKFTNFTNIDKPLSIKVYIDKRICLNKQVSNYSKKIYFSFSIGGMKTNIFNIYSTESESLFNESLDGGAIFNHYQDVYNTLQMTTTDEFIVAQKYFLDPIRGY